MEAGRLDRRITIERATVETDPFGGETPTWAEVATVWASVEWVKDGERLRAAELAASADVRFQIRWGFGVTVEDRITYDGRVYDILGVKEIGRHEGQELSASARAEA